MSAIVITVMLIAAERVGELALSRPLATSLILRPRRALAEMV
jgi:hypothetical protein